jgi:hypothetical protein
MTDEDIPFRSMTLDEFIPLVGQVFTIDSDLGPVELMLVEANAKKHLLTDFPAPFILIFLSPLGVLIEDRIYTLRCGEWGPDKIFIAPTLPTPGGEPGQYYQATFN